MAYGKSGGCTPITSKIKKTTKGGIVQPILNVGKVSPAKMKGDLNKDGKMSSYEQTRQNAIDKAMSSPAKKMDPSIYKNTKKKSGEPKYTPGSNKPGESMTPYSVKDGKGTIHGPKVSYDMAYKNRGAAYKDMSKAEYIQEAKRQTKSFESTGKWDAPKPRKTQKVASTTIKPAKTVTIETKQPTASTEITPKVETKKAPEVSAKKVKQVKRISSRAEKTRKKGEAALASGNVRKAQRLRKRYDRLEDRASKKAARGLKQAERKQQRKQKQSTTRKPGSTFRNIKR